MSLQKYNFYVTTFFFVVILLIRNDLDIFCFISEVNCWLLVYKMFVVNSKQIRFFSLKLIHAFRIDLIRPRIFCIALRVFCNKSNNSNQHCSMHSMINASGNHVMSDTIACTSCCILHLSKWEYFSILRKHLWGQLFVCSI